MYRQWCLVNSYYDSVYVVHPTLLIAAAPLAPVVVLLVLIIEEVWVIRKHQKWNETDLQITYMEYP